MSRFTDLEQFINLIQENLGMKIIVKRNIKTYFVFLVFRMSKESKPKFDELKSEEIEELKNQLNPCIYKKR
jgi:hypothetical protein